MDMPCKSKLTLTTCAKQILIVDDHELIYKGLKTQLSEGFDLFYASSLEAARTALSTQTFCCCILDISFGGDTSFEFLQKTALSMPVFMLSMHKTFSYIKMARDFGASGYFLKDEGMELLTQAIADPSKRDFWATETVLHILSDQNTQTVFKELSDREKQVFILFAEGLNYKEVAHQLSLSPKTVNTYKARLFSKLKLTSLVDLANEAQRLGLTLP